MKVSRYFLVFIFFLGSSQIAFAQCEDALIDARASFESGNVERIPSSLFNCLDQLTKADQVEAYKLLSISYLYMDDPIGAENSFLALLEVDPEFKVSPSDPIELVYLSRQYITTPITSYALKLGGNISTVTVLNQNSIEASPTDIKYKPRGGFNLQGAFNLHFNKVVSLMVELELSSWSYNKEFRGFQLSEGQTFNSIRTNIQASIPIGLKLKYPGEKTFPYIYGGYSPSYALWAFASDERNPDSSPPITANNLNLLPQVNQFNHSIIVGAGLEKRIGQRFGYHYLLFDIRYRIGMTNITNEKTQFDTSNPDNVRHLYEFGQVDDDYRWNSLEFSLGYVWPNYKPRSKNSVTIQTVVKKWFTKKDKGSE